MSELTGKQIAEAGLDGWAYLLGGLQSRIRTPDFKAGLALVDAIGAAAEEMDHHPDLDLRFTHVDVRLRSHDVGAVTGRDLRLARRISQLAAEAGLSTDCTDVSRLELALDSPQFQRIQPFWSAVLAMKAGRDDVVDPDGALPVVWFQASGAEEPRQRWHPDVWVDPSQVRPRIDAAIAAGGILFSDAEAPSFWVLADPEGNKVCLCTWQDRGENWS
ncbi:4a-hydroxytetrahydrobiopterin dehydratase [Actinoplanes sp. NPDC051633]|uniref:4a-hydroxytetrahydrobiopterin dehydratase n=1 Tax=Actinoplanes sp. NPDC051633 TaxID=3155670 RepID=UPI00341F067E